MITSSPDNHNHTAPSLSDKQIQASVALPLPLRPQHLLPTWSAAMVLTLHLKLQVPLLVHGFWTQEILTI